MEVISKMTMVKCGEIFDECENAIGVAMNGLYVKRPDHFLLFLARGEYHKELENIPGTTPYVMDYYLDLHNNKYQQEFITRYLRRNYRTDGFSYQNELDVNDLITEMMIYSHVWEDVGFLKLLVRLSRLLDEKDYIWQTNLEYHNELYTVIQKKVVKLLKRHGYALGDLIESAYSSNIRNAFAHNMYSIDYDRRKIRIWGGRKQDDCWTDEIDFDEYQTKFLKTIRIWNMLYYLCEQCRINAAKDELYSNAIPLPDGRKLYIRTEMKQRGDYMEPYFGGVVAKNRR